VRNRLDVAISAMVTAGFGVLELLLVYETWALATGHRPLTDYIRPAVHAYPGWAFVIAVATGLILGHLLWGAPVGPTSLRERD
jgi:hypothetical protein